MKATNLKKIELRTQKGDGSNEVPLMELKQSFEEKNVIFSFYYDENLHDREIRYCFELCLMFFFFCAIDKLFFLLNIAPSD